MDDVELEALELELFELVVVAFAVLDFVAPASPEAVLDAEDLLPEGSAPRESVR
ncbi:hypothetical protein [Gephyromycinifex aptenodytis]|uniref:hypothetical protein n=1 Tax=Gephyromycinifex aptenodytis TaxID=2716227 RepID=UPI0029CA696B|nr:hypothetical protein [Gephyromycinifex aptenodytis]